MPSYRIHRLRNHLRDHFRFAPHVTGAANIKPRDYEPGEAVEAPSPYAAFFAMKQSVRPLLPGDVLESTEDGCLRIYKYVGFEEARWMVPEIKPDIGVEAAAGAAPQEVLDRL